MENLFKGLKKILKEGISLGLTFLSLGVIIQILIDDKILGWDPVGNIQDAGSAFIGIIAFILLYILFIQKK
tara:strand:- start:2540 stop:2752 length:213 start_codon:yes stop_codon:yes gene_type:complete